MTERSDKAAAKARADSIHAQIAALEEAAAKPAGRAGARTVRKKPAKESPRDFVHRRMNELDE